MSTRTIDVGPLGLVLRRQTPSGWWTCVGTSDGGPIPEALRGIVFRRRRMSPLRGWWDAKWRSSPARKCKVFHSLQEAVETALAHGLQEARRA